MRYKLLLIAIIVLAASIRLYKLGEIPQGLYIDEPSLGYNAYTILKTGKDEYGNRFPLEFKAYGEYKLPGYIYASVPIIATLGLNQFSIRLLSALAGIAGVWGIYLVAKLVTKDQAKLNSSITPIVAALLWAVSPWNVQLSRAAFEANLMVTLVIFMAYFLLKYIKSGKATDGGVALLSAVGAFYTYNAARVFVPLFLMLSLLLFRNQIPKLKSAVVVLIFIAICVPAFMLMTSTGNNRVKQVLEFENKEFNLGPVLGVTQKYLSHFSSNFLLFKGDTSTPRHSVTDLGLVYFPEGLTILIGLIMLVKNRDKYAKCIGLWILLAPLPAAFATPAPHALRASALLPPLILLSAIGITTVIQAIYKNVSHPLVKSGYYAIFVVVSVYSVFTYFHVYYKHYQYRVSWDWNEQVTLLAQHITKNYPESENSYVIEGNSIDLIYYKFFNASRNKPTNDSKFTFVGSGSPITPQNGQVIAISGWKGAPQELKNVTELRMKNQSIGYKVGVWQK